MPKQDYPIYAIRRYRLNLDEATAFHKVNFRGDFLWAIESSNKTVTANVRIGEVSADAVPIRYGTQFDGLQFNELWFSWDAQPGEWIDLVVAETNGRLEARNAVAYEVDVGGVVQTVPAVQNQAGTFLADQRYSISVRANFIPQEIIRNSYTVYKNGPVIGESISAYYYHYKTKLHYYIEYISDTEKRLRARNENNQVVHDVKIELPSNWGAFYSEFIVHSMTWDEHAQAFLIGCTKQSSVSGGVAKLHLSGKLENLDSRFPSGNNIYVAITTTDKFLIGVRQINESINIRDRNGVVVATLEFPTIVDPTNGFGLFVRDNILWANKDGNVDAFDLSDFSVHTSASVSTNITNDWASYDPTTDLAMGFRTFASAFSTHGSTFGWSLNAPGYVTIERECASLRLAKPDRYIVQTGAEFSGGRIYGEVIRAALDAYFAPRIVGDDYLDHVYEAEFLGEGVKVSGGFTSLARAGIADAFSIRYPVNARLVIDSNMPLSTISGV